MKKSFLATSAKLLVATSILAMSTTALATSSAKLDTAVKKTLSVAAHYVVPLTASLSVGTIDFGDVWTDSDVPVVNVLASLTGENAETFSYSVKTTNNSSRSLVLLTGDILGEADATDVFAEGVATLNFSVGLATNLLTDADDTVTETVTLSVIYDAIAPTSVDGTEV
jgi:hypothetical protein